MSFMKQQLLYSSLFPCHISSAIREPCGISVYHNDQYVAAELNARIACLGFAGGAENVSYMKTYPVSAAEDIDLIVQDLAADFMDYVLSFSADTAKPRDGPGL